MRLGSAKWETTVSCEGSRVRREVCDGGETHDVMRGRKMVGGVRGRNWRARRPKITDDENNKGEETVLGPLFVGACIGGAK